MKIIEDISDTQCKSDCCRVPGFPGVCNAHWACQHHAEDFDRARAKAAQSSMRTELNQRVFPGPATRPMSSAERAMVLQMKGHKTAKEVAQKFNVAERTIHRIWHPKGIQAPPNPRQYVAHA